MFLMGIFWYHLYDMSNYKLCNLDTYNHNFGSSVGILPVAHPTNRGLRIAQQSERTTQKAHAWYILIPCVNESKYIMCIFTTIHGKA